LGPRTQGVGGGAGGKRFLEKETETKTGGKKGKVKEGEGRWGKKKKKAVFVRGKLCPPKKLNHGEGRREKTSQHENQVQLTGGNWGETDKREANKNEPEKWGSTEEDVGARKSKKKKVNGQKKNNL